MKAFRKSLLIPIVLLASACAKPQEEAMSAGEVVQAFAENQDADEASNLIGETVDGTSDEAVKQEVREIQTTLTMGDRIKAAHERLRDIFREELKCADVEVGLGKVTIDYGVKGTCKYNLTGQHTIQVDSIPDDGKVVVSHAWTNLSNQKVSVSGTATVTWDRFGDKTASAPAPSHSIEHSLTWTAKRAPGRTWTATGNRTHTLLPGGLAEGVEINGSRTWERSDGPGAWTLAIEDVEVEWGLPAPRKGTYVLTSPRDKTLTLTFNQLDEDTVRIHLETGRFQFELDISLTTGAQSQLKEL